MDALSDLLRVVRLSGGIFLDAEFTAPWCIAAQVGPEDCRMVMAEPARVIAFHYVAEGRLLLQAGDGRPVEVGSGAVVMLPRNDPHTLASGSGLKPASGSALIQAEPERGLARIRYGGGGAPSRIVCGFVGMDAERHPLIDALPPILLLDLNGLPAEQWVSSAFRYAAGDLAAVRAGSAIMLAKLSELLFVEAVRRYVDALPGQQSGWLAGLRDPVVGRALALLHTHIARPWTTETLAGEVHLSRSSFAERFTALVGMPPMHYLAAWRMQAAAQRLRDSRRSVAQIADEVGYQSEAAFTRAFKREFSLAPGQWRRQSAGVRQESPRRQD